MAGPTGSRARGALIAGSVPEKRLATFRRKIESLSRFDCVPLLSSLCTAGQIPPAQTFLTTYVIFLLTSE